MAHAAGGVTAEEPYLLAREVFARTLITSKQAVACEPRPRMGSFFGSIAVNRKDILCKIESDEGPSAMLERFRPRRVLVPDLVPREETPRGRCRPGKLTPDQLKDIQQQPHRTLRELVEAYGVSHETMRATRSSSSTDGE